VISLYFKPFSLDEFCEASLSAEKKFKLLITAEKYFGESASWNSSTIARLCNMIEVMTPKQFLALKAQEVLKFTPTRFGVLVDESILHKNTIILININ